MSGVCRDGEPYASQVGALGCHDLGGCGVHEPLLSPEVLERGRNESFQLWETQIHAIVGLLRVKKLSTTDEMRRAIEALLPQSYAGMTYYQKWASATAAVCIERGTITQADLDKHLGPPVESDDTVRFAVGDIVTVRAESLATRWRRPHLRTPGYIFGVTGEVERVVGVFKSPERLAYRHVEGVQPLYRVRFKIGDVWPALEGGSADGGTDTVDIEIYQTWLQAASAAEPGSAAGGEASHPQRAGVVVHHTHDHEDPNGHTHEERDVVEHEAIDREVPPPAIATALMKALLETGTITAEELQEATSLVDSWGQQAEGARLVARAWTDPAFKVNTSRLHIFDVRDGFDISV